MGIEQAVSDHVELLVRAAEEESRVIYDGVYAWIIAGLLRVVLLSSKQNCRINFDCFDVPSTRSQSSGNVIACPRTNNPTSPALPAMR